MSENDEIELLETFVKTCRTVRDPRNRRARTALAIPAAQWEMKFTARIEQLKSAKPAAVAKEQPEPVAA